MPQGSNSLDKVFIQFLQDFLCRSDKERFNKFFDLCYLRCRNYLRVLRAKGWMLPVDARMDKDPIDDLTIDVLGSMLPVECTSTD